MKLRTSVLAFRHFQYLVLPCGRRIVLLPAQTAPMTVRRRSIPTPFCRRKRSSTNGMNAARRTTPSTPPRGISNYTKINEQGMVVNARPVNDSITVLKPMRPEAPAANPAAPPSKNADPPLLRQRLRQ